MVCVSVDLCAEALVYDLKSNQQVIRLQGHYDYSFAAAWHPDAYVIATGNQVSKVVDYCDVDGHDPKIFVKRFNSYDPSPGWGCM